MSFAPDTTLRPVPRGTAPEPGAWVDLDRIAFHLGEAWLSVQSSDALPWLGLGVVALVLVGAVRQARRQSARWLAGVGAPGATDVRACSWRRDRVRRTSRLTRWQCRRCGVDAFTTDGRPP